MLGLSRMERVDFADNDIQRCLVSYSNGARAWINRSKADWTVEGYRLPPLGYLVRGPDEFLEYRAIKDCQIVDVVHCQQYHYFACARQTDFGPIITDGALAVAREGTDRLLLYEIQKPGAIV